MVGADTTAFPSRFFTNAPGPRSALRNTRLLNTNTLHRGCLLLVLRELVVIFFQLCHLLFQLRQQLRGAANLLHHMELLREGGTFDNVLRLLLVQLS